MLRQHLDGDVTPETRVARTIDFAHTPRTQRGDDFVGTEAVTGGKMHVGLLYGAERCAGYLEVASSCDQFMKTFRMDRRPSCAGTLNTRLWPSGAMSASAVSRGSLNSVVGLPA